MDELPHVLTRYRHAGGIINEDTDHAGPDAGRGPSTSYLPAVARRGATATTHPCEESVFRVYIRGF